MYEEILLPVDGSPGAATALHHAAELAHRTDATIRLLHVADTTEDSLTVVESDVVDALVEEGRGIVEEAGETLDTLGVAYGTDVVQGTPAPTIVEYAEEYGYDLIVMSTHGRETLSRYLLGSVTEKVVRLSQVPVLTLRMQPDESVTFPYERVLLPTDGSSGAEHAARHGLSLAASFDAAVHVLSVTETASIGPDVRSVLSDSELERAATEAVDSIVSEAEDRGIADVTGHVEQGSPAEEIQAAVDASDVHAVVMGTTGRRGVDRVLLGSVAEKTVRSTPVPVFTVAPGEGSRSDQR